MSVFIQSKCNAIGSHRDRPMPLPLESLHIGNRVTHHSHKLSVLRGLVFCSKCGMRGPSKLLNLSLQCVEPTDYGLRNLNAINAGKLPPELDSWPDEPAPVKRKIDKATRINPKDVPPSFEGIRVKRPRPIFNSAGLSTNNLSVSSAVSASVRAEQALPPKLLNLIELSSLESSGIKVVWPDGINARIAHELIFDFFEHSASESEEIDENPAQMDTNTVIQNGSQDSNIGSSAFRENLKELLSLSDEGESVCWPEGFSSLRARQFLSESLGSNK